MAIIKDKTNLIWYNFRRMTFTVFLILGITSLISQVIIIRELLNTFYGNEFFIGLVLGSWLLWTALGSGLVGKLISKFKPENISKTLIYSYLIIAIFLPLEIFLIRFIKIWVGLPGEIPNLFAAILFSILVNAPLCLILGSQWTLATRIFSEFSLNPVRKELILHPSRPRGAGLSNGVKRFLIIGRGYFFETLGFVFGGILFYYFLIHQNEFLVIFTVAGLNLLTAILFSREKSYFILKTILILFLFLFCFLAISPISNYFNHFTQQLRFPKQELVESKNTIFGNIAITKIKEQFNFFETGSLLGSQEETQFNEDLIHFPLLFHSNPQKILLIGTGFNGALREILKHKPEEIYYAELDPQSLEVIKKYLPEELKEILNNPKIKIIKTDPRYFLKKSSEKFDVVIINLPSPSTALLNRYYTKEFFQEIKNHLRGEAIFSTHLPYSPSYPNQELINLNASIYQTLKEVFPFIILLPEDTNFFIASLENILGSPSEGLIQRFKDRIIETQYLNENYITYRLTNDRVFTTLNILEENTKVKRNLDLTPHGYFYNILYWLSHFYLKLSKVLALPLKINFASLAFLLVLPPILMRFLKKKLARENSLILAMAIASFSLMAIEIILILTFQIFFGNLYYQIVLLITILMLGMASGTYLANKKLEKNSIDLNKIKNIHLAILIYCFLLISIFYYLPKIEFIFLILAMTIGFLVGLEFTFINKLYLEKQKNAKEKTGIIYSADLFGACLGAFLPSLFLIPIFGVLQVLILLAIFNFSVFALLIHGKPEQ